jgi:hypothetical protein
MSIDDKKGAARREATYDTIKPGSGGGITADDVPPGRYTAIISGAILQDMNENGQSLRLVFDLCDDAVAGTEVPTWFKFYRADGTINEFAIGLWKTTLAKLGYQDVKEAELPELLEQVTVDRPGVIVKVSYQNVQGRIYPRVDVEGLCDNDIVAAYKDKHQVEAPY